MKTLRSFMLLLGLLLSSTVFYSCLDDDDNDYFYDSLFDNLKAIVTIKPIDDSSFYMQVDDTTTFYPEKPYALDSLRETRAFIIYNYSDTKTPGYDHTVNIVRLDTLLTKDIAPDLGLENDTYYGTDPVGLNGNSIWNPDGVWIEDGYITFDFILYRGHNDEAKHFMNLVQSNSLDPYELEFRHNAHGDAQLTLASGLVSFRLDKLPNTGGQTVKLKIKYKSLSSDNYKTIELDYKSKN